jgi:hypothetical protein
LVGITGTVLVSSGKGLALDGEAGAGCWPSAAGLLWLFAAVSSLAGAWASNSDVAAKQAVTTSTNGKNRFISLNLSSPIDPATQYCQGAPSFSASAPFAEKRGKAI